MTRLWRYVKAHGRNWLIPLAFAALMFVVLSSFQSRASQNKALDRLTRVGRQVKTVSDQQTATITAQTATIDRLTRQIAALNQAAGDQSARIGDLTRQLADAEQQLAAAQERQDQLRRLVISEYQQLLARPPTVVMVPGSGPAATVKPGSPPTTMARPPVTTPPPACGPLLHEIGLC